MNKKLYFSVMLICFLVFGLVFISCGSGNLAGIWEIESVENGQLYDVVDRVEFFKDGTGNMQGFSITWKTEGNRIMITAFGKAQTHNYKLSGSTLTITQDTGLIAVYKRVR